MRPNAKMLGLIVAVLAVSGLMVFSAFFQTSIIVAVKPSTTVILRFDAGSFHLERYDSEVWLESTIACTPTFQRFGWWEFWYTHSPISGDWDIIFPIWTLLVPMGVLSLWMRVSKPANSEML